MKTASSSQGDSHPGQRHTPKWKSGCDGFLLPECGLRPRRPFLTDSVDGVASTLSLTSLARGGATGCPLVSFTSAERMDIRPPGLDAGESQMADGVCCCCCCWIVSFQRESATRSPLSPESNHKNDSIVIPDDSGSDQLPPPGGLGECCCCCCCCCCCWSPMR